MTSVFGSADLQIAAPRQKNRRQSCYQTKLCSRSSSPFVINDFIKKSELWLIFAALKRGLNLEKSCQKTPTDGRAPPSG